MIPAPAVEVVRRRGRGMARQGMHTERMSHGKQMSLVQLRPRTTASDGTRPRGGGAGRLQVVRPWQVSFANTLRQCLALPNDSELAHYSCKNGYSESCLRWKIGVQVPASTNKSLSLSSLLSHLSSRLDVSRRLARTCQQQQWPTGQSTINQALVWGVLGGSSYPLVTEQPISY